MALIATYPQEAVFEATAFEIRFKLSMDMSRQVFTLDFQLLNQGRVVFLYKLVEQGLLWAMAFISGVTEGILAWREHVTSHLAFGHRVNYRVGQSGETIHIGSGQGRGAMSSDAATT